MSANVIVPDMTADEAKLSRLRVAEARREVAETHADYLRSKEVAGDKKKSYEAAVAHLLDVIDDESRGPGPLFEGKGVDDGIVPPDDEPDDGDWRGEVLAGVIDSDPILKALAEHAPPIRTMGDLADFTAGGGHLRDVKGIGPAKVEAIEAATERFWTARAPKLDAGEPGDAPADGGDTTYLAVTDAEGNGEPAEQEAIDSPSDGEAEAEDGTPPKRRKRAKRS